jgi:hypothetical protein
MRATLIDMITKQLPNYPILDHPYAREEIERGADRLQALWNGGYSRSSSEAGRRSAFDGRRCTPQEVSAFQECETALLGLGSPTSRGGRGRRGRGGAEAAAAVMESTAGLRLAPNTPRKNSTISIPTSETSICWLSPSCCCDRPETTASSKTYWDPARAASTRRVGCPPAVG